MLNLEVKSKLGQEEVIKKAVSFFGPGGYGLKITEQNDCLVTLEGGGGGVSVSTCLKDDKTLVNIISREWDYQVKEFTGKIS
jgi:hypothetical protein